MWMLSLFASFETAAQRKLQQENSIVHIVRMVMEKLSSGRFCLYAKAEAGSSVV